MHCSRAFCPGNHAGLLYLSHTTQQCNTTDQATKQILQGRKGSAEDPVLGNDGSSLLHDNVYELLAGCRAAVLKGAIALNNMGAAICVLQPCQLRVGYSPLLLSTVWQPLAGTWHPFSTLQQHFAAAQAPERHVSTGQC